MMKFFGCWALILALLHIEPAHGQSSIPVLNAAFLANNLTNVAQTVKLARGNVAWLICSNPNVAITWVQTFDTTAAVTVGTTTPKVSLPIQASAVQYQPILDITHLNAIKIAAATTATGGTAPAAPIVCSVGFR